MFHISSQLLLDNMGFLCELLYLPAYIFALCCANHQFECHSLPLTFSVYH